MPSELIAPLQVQILDVLEAVRRIPEDVRSGLPKMTTTTTTTKTEATSGENRHITMRDFYIMSGSVLAGWAIRTLFP